MKNPKEIPAPVQARMLNVREAAQYLGCTIWFMRTLAWEKKLRSVIFGNRMLFDRADLDAFLEKAKAEAV